MTTKYGYVRDINGYNGYALKFTDTGYNAILTASTDTTLTVPGINSIGGATFESVAKPQLVALIKYTDDVNVWVALNATASAPAGSSFAASKSRLNPDIREVQSGDVLHFFTTASNVNVDVSFYWIGQ